MFGRRSSPHLSSLCPGYISPRPPPSSWPSTCGSFLPLFITIHLDHPFCLRQAILSPPFLHCVLAYIIDRDFTWIGGPSYRNAASQLLQSLPWACQVQGIVHGNRQELKPQILRHEVCKALAVSSIIHLSLHVVPRFSTCHHSLSWWLMRSMAFGHWQ